MSNTLDFQLLGKDYRVACPPAERDVLLAAVTMVETRLSKLNEKVRGTNERLATMAAIDLAHELLVLKATPASDAAAIENEMIQRRINSIEARVVAALEQHQNLF